MRLCLLLEAVVTKIQMIWNQTYTWNIVKASSYSILEEILYPVVLSKQMQI